MVETRDKIVAAISYLSWLLFFVAYVVNGEQRSRFVTHHLNQAFVLQVISTVCVIFASMPQIPLFGTVIRIIGKLLSFVVFVYLIWGIVNAVRGSDEDIPGLNAFQVFK